MCLCGDYVMIQKQIMHYEPAYGAYNAGVYFIMDLLSHYTQLLYIIAAKILVGMI